MWLHWRCLTLLLLRGRLVLWLHWRRLMRLLQLWTLMLLLNRRCLVLLRRGFLALLLLRGPLTRLLLRWLLALHVLRGSLIVCLYLCRHADVVVGRERLVDGHAGRAAMVHIGKLRPVGAGDVLILQLRSHGGGMLFVASRQLRGPGPHLQSARSAVETYSYPAPVLIAHRPVVDVMQD